MTAAESPGKCNAVISLAPGRGATFTCDKPDGHVSDHASINLFLRVQWTDEHRKAFRIGGQS